jgi:hypothetical protein
LELAFRIQQLLASDCLCQRFDPPGGGDHQVVPDDDCFLAARCLDRDLYGTRVTDRVAFHRLPQAVGAIQRTHSPTRGQVESLNRLFKDVVRTKQFRQVVGRDWHIFGPDRAKLDGAGNLALPKGRYEWTPETDGETEHWQHPEGLPPAPDDHVGIPAAMTKGFHKRTKLGRKGWNRKAGSRSGFNRQYYAEVGRFLGEIDSTR